jgi:hypothetical protein
VMIESHLIQELLAETRHEDILRFLSARFGSVSDEIARQVRAVREPQTLDDLVKYAAQCSDLDAFRARLA